MTGKGYEKCHCGADCIYVNDEDEVCEGPVSAADDADDDYGYEWVHCCRKHVDYYIDIDI